MDPRFLNAPPPRFVRDAPRTSQIRLGIVGGGVALVLATQVLSFASGHDAWGFLVFAALGVPVAALVIAESHFRIRRDILRRYAAAMGVIVGPESGALTESGRGELTRFRYWLPEGRAFDCFVSLSPDKADEYPAGTPITVLYDPMEPGACLPAFLLTEAELV